MTRKNLDPQPLYIRNVHIAGNTAARGPTDISIRDGRITSITNHSGMEVSDSSTAASAIDSSTDRSARVIDGTGHTLIPGLIDAHLHFDYLGIRNTVSAAVRTRRHRTSLQELLHNGVTAVRTMADPLAQIRQLQQWSTKPHHLGPKMRIAGPALTAPGGHPQVTVCRDNPWLEKHMTRGITGTGQARDTVRALNEQGVDLIKIVVQGDTYAEFGDTLRKLADSEVEAVIDAAHALGMRVSAHTHYQDDVAMLLRMGIDSIEHGVIEHEITDEEFLTQWAESGVPLISTLVIDDLVRNETGESYLATASTNLLRAHAAGVQIVAGTDSMIGSMTASSLHDELHLLVEAGLTPAAALESATAAGAELLGLRDHGRVEVGAVADLLLLRKDPLAGIEATRDIAAVIQNGVVVHEPPQSARLTLPDFAPPPSPLLSYSDTSGGAFDNEATVSVDVSAFGAKSVRTLTFADPATGKILRRETLRSAPTLTTLEWTCTVPEDGTDLFAKLAGDRVELTGMFENSAVEQSYELRGQPWLQGMFFDLSTFMDSSSDILTFVAIGTRGRGALKASEFEVAKGGRSGSATMVMPRWRRWWSAQVDSDPTDHSLVAVDLGQGKTIKRIDCSQLADHKTRGGL